MAVATGGGRAAASAPRPAAGRPGGGGVLTPEGGGSAGATAKDRAFKAKGPESSSRFTRNGKELRGGIPKGQQETRMAERASRAGQPPRERLKAVANNEPVVAKPRTQFGEKHAGGRARSPETPRGGKPARPVAEVAVKPTTGEAKPTQAQQQRAEKAGGSGASKAQAPETKALALRQPNAGEASGSQDTSGPKAQEGKAQSS